MTLTLLALLACSQPSDTPPPEAPPPAPPEKSAAAQLIDSAKGVFGALPTEAANPNNPSSEARINLGRMLYYDTRLSKNQDLSCNSCHLLDNFGQDSKPTSPGHKGQLGGRNSPTVYNAALHVQQFWDGRAKDVEEQAKGPVLNPIEMAMKDEASVVAVLKSIPGYADAFKAAFPDEADPITYDNMAKAIGAFERKLLTPSRFDAFLAGDEKALTDGEQQGLRTYMEVGCASCHGGVALGGQMFQKLGAVKPYETKDNGRFDVTQNEADRFVFKVPSLRNVEKTGPYLHDGSVASLPEMVKIMGSHQLGRDLSDEQVAQIETFLKTLTGTPDAAYIALPTLPESGPQTPKPDPS